MNRALFFDTETTGLPSNSLADYDDDQPHLVQLAACLVDLDTRRILSSIDLMVKPVGWVIPEAVTAIHGISTAQALASGVPESMATELLLTLGQGVLRVAHNLAFDDHILRIAVARHFSDEYNEWYEYPDAQGYCTMTAATPIMALPASARMVAAGHGHKYKAPRLAEAYQHFTGQPMTNAHNAMADVLACMAVYFAMQDMAGGLA